MPCMRMHSGLLPREPWPPLSSGHSFTQLLSRVRDVWPFCAAVRRQRFVYGTHLKRVRELHSHRQLAAVRYRRTAADRPTRPSVSPRPTTTVRAPTTTVRAPRRGGSERPGGSERRCRRATCRQHRCWAIGSSLRQSKTPTPPRDHSAPLRFAVLRLLLRSCWLLYFPVCSSPFCRYSFSLLCPRPHRFLHTSRPVSTINRVTLFAFVRAVYCWLYCTARCVLFAFLVLVNYFASHIAWLILNPRGLEG